MSGLLGVSGVADERRGHGVEGAVEVGRGGLHRLDPFGAFDDVGEVDVGVDQVQQRSGGARGGGVALEQVIVAALAHDRDTVSS
jgi:hypothetical protein